jgi:hypothetical protein
MGAGGLGVGTESHLIVAYHFLFSPKKIWVDENLVIPPPPDDIINKRAYPTLVLLWRRGLLRWNGHRMTGGDAESQFDCRVFFSDSPLKNVMDRNLVFPRPPRWIHKQTSVPNVGLTVGKGSIASEWALEDGRRPESQFDCRVFFLILPLKIWRTEI